MWRRDPVYIPIDTSDVKSQTTVALNSNFNALSRQIDKLDRNDPVQLEQLKELLTKRGAIANELIERRKYQYGH